MALVKAKIVNLTFADMVYEASLQYYRFKPVSSVNSEYSVNGGKIMAEVEVSGPMSTTCKVSTLGVHSDACANGDNKAVILTVNDDVLGKYHVLVVIKCINPDPKARCLYPKYFISHIFSMNYKKICMQCRDVGQVNGALNGSASGITFNHYTMPDLNTVSTTDAYYVELGIGGRLLSAHGCVNRPKMLIFYKQNGDYIVAHKPDDPAWSWYLDMEFIMKVYQDVKKSIDGITASTHETDKDEPELQEFLDKLEAKPEVKTPETKPEVKTSETKPTVPKPATIAVNKHHTVGIIYNIVECENSQPTIEFNINLDVGILEFKFAMQEATSIYAIIDGEACGLMEGVKFDNGVATLAFPPATTARELTFYTNKRIINSDLTGIKIR